MTKEMVHFSDGQKVVCEAEDALGVKDPQEVTCRACLDYISEQAEQEDDPFVEVKIFNRDLKDGADFNFTYRRPAELSARGKVKKAFPIQNIRLVSGAKHRLRRSLVEHLELLASPLRKYVQGAEEGKSMQIAGKRHRFAVQRV